MAPVALRAFVEDGWLYGRGAGDMKAGIVCALAAFKALDALGARPAGAVGFNAVLEEENTGNGALATVAALRSAVGAGKLASFDTVVIPEPLGECLMSAQMGVFWMFVELTGRPAHAAYMTSGVNPVEAGIAVMAGLRELEAEWNLPQNRPAAYREHAHRSTSTSARSMAASGILGAVHLHAGRAHRLLSGHGRERCQGAGRGLHPRHAGAPDSNLDLAIRYEGFHAPGCEFDLDTPSMAALGEAHRKVHGEPVRRRHHGHHRCAPLQADAGDARDLLRAGGTQHPRHRRIRLHRQHGARDHHAGAVHPRLVRRRARRRGRLRRP